VIKYFSKSKSIIDESYFVKATRSSATAEIRERDILGSYIHLLRLTPPTEGFPGTIALKFCTEVKGWLRYRMVKKYCRKFQPSG